MGDTGHTVGVGTALRALRLSAEMTLDQVAEAAGVSPSYLSRAENDQVTPKTGWVSVVAIAIGDHLAARAGTDASSDQRVPV